MGTLENEVTKRRSGIDGDGDGDDDVVVGNEFDDPVKRVYLARTAPTPKPNTESKDSTSASTASGGQRSFADAMRTAIDGRHNFIKDKDKGDDDDKTDDWD